MDVRCKVCNALRRGVERAMRVFGTGTAASASSAATGREWGEPLPKLQHSTRLAAAAVRHTERSQARDLLLLTEP